MAKPNYSFEKRQRELAKKQKKEDKAREKAERKSAGGHAVPGEPGTEGDDGAALVAVAPADPAQEPAVQDPATRSPTP